MPKENPKRTHEHEQLQYTYLTNTSENLNT